MDTKWFRGRMKSLGLNQDDIGAALRHDRSAVSRIIQGSRPLHFDEIEPLAEALKVPVFELLYRAGLWRSGRVPVLHAAFLFAAAEAAAFYASPPEHKPIATDAVITEYPADTLFALRIADDAMDLIAPSGSTIVIDYSHRELRDGDLAVFRREGEAIFRRYRHSARQRFLEPASSNPRHERLFPAAIETIGRVVEIRPEYPESPEKRK
jgi:repressor LexA